MATITTGQIRKEMRTEQVGHWAFALVQYGVLIAFLLIAIVPFFWVFSTSLKTTKEVAQNPLGFPTALHLDNYSKAWVQGRFGKYMRNSIVVSIPIVLGGLSLSTLAGYAFARLHFRGRNTLFLVFLLGMMIPFQSIMIPLYYTLRDIGFIGTYLAMVVPSIALELPFGIFFMRAFFMDLPSELEDAARIDGCDAFGVFWRIMLPLATPSLSALAVFEFMGAWNSFLLPLIYMQKEELRPVVLGLMFFKGEYTQNYPLTMAGAAIVMLPIMVMYVIFQRKFIEGLTAGALKG